jgi:hypothetical protein
MDNLPEETNLQNTPTQGLGYNASDINSPMPPVPHPHPQGKKGKLALVVLLFVIMVGAIYFYRGLLVKQKKSPEVQTSDTGKVPLSVLPDSTGHATFDDVFKTENLEIVNSQDIDVSVLPAELRDFIVTSATATAVTKISLNGGGQAYTIDYSASEKLLDLHNQFLMIHSFNKLSHQRDYIVASAIHTDQSSHIEKENNFYKLNIQAGFVAMTKSQVHIVVIVKK